MASAKISPLHSGDRIAIAAPSGAFDPKRFRKAVHLLKKSGFRPRYRRDIFSRRGYLAGSDQRRAAELNDILTDPTIKAVLFARGGFGCQRILPLLKNRIVGHKILIGSSDLTTLLLHFWKKLKRPSYYGPMVAPHLIHERSVKRLVKILTNPEVLKKQRLTAKKIIRPGKAEGRLMGGCLSLIIASLGTPWEIETKGSILFLEDTHELPYAIDRMLTHLEQAGKFKGVKGIILGTFRMGKVCFPKRAEDVFREKFKTFKGPVLWGLPFGHCPQPLILPLGGRAKIVGKRLMITRGIF